MFLLMMLLTMTCDINNDIYDGTSTDVNATLMKYEKGTLFLEMNSLMIQKRDSFS